MNSRIISFPNAETGKKIVQHIRRISRPDRRAQALGRGTNAVRQQNQVLVTSCVFRLASSNEEHASASMPAARIFAAVSSAERDRGLFVFTANPLLANGAKIDRTSPISLSPQAPKIRLKVDC